MSKHQQVTGRASTPHLASLDGTAAEQVTAMAWARYLGNEFGSSGAIRALRFYKDAGWISESVYRTMVDYVRGLSVDELSEDALSDETSIDSLTDTPYEGHARSLEYVAAIAGDSIERDLTTLRLGQDGISSNAGIGGGPAETGVPKDSQCAATTDDGEPCTRPALGDSEYCHDHHEELVDETADEDG